MIGAYTHVPLNLAEELAVMVVALSKVVRGDEDIPATSLPRSDTVVEHVPQPGAVVLVGVVRFHIDVVPCKLLELATPVLQRR